MTSLAAKGKDVEPADITAMSFAQVLEHAMRNADHSAVADRRGHTSSVRASTTKLNAMQFIKVMTRVHCMNWNFLWAAIASCNWDCEGMACIVHWCIL